jgi:DNA polymerase-3 subunit delta'
LNKNSINALLKILEEPNKNINFLLINNNKKILSKLLSRCINFKISLTSDECLKIIEKILGHELKNLINEDLINYYTTPGQIYYLLKFANANKLNLVELDLKKLLKIIIKDSHYKKDLFIKYMVFDLIELYFRKLNFSFSKTINQKYSYFLKRISDTKTFNLDDETLFADFDEEILNG